MRKVVVVLMMMFTAQAMAVEIIAHRGAAHDAPENTLASYRLAWQDKADAIEGDFRYTKDRQIVCMHDATGKRTAGNAAKIADLTFVQVRKLDAGSWKAEKFKGEPIPTLQEVLAVVRKGKRLYLEIKIGVEIVPDIKKQIAESGLEASQVVVISFDEKVIAAAKQALPEVKAYWIYSFKKTDGKWSATHDELMATLAKIKADGLSVGFTPESAEIVNGDLARKLRDARLELNLWTIDDVPLACRALELKPTSLTTNRAGWLREQLGM